MAMNEPTPALCNLVLGRLRCDHTMSPPSSGTSSAAPSHSWMMSDSLYCLRLIDADTHSGEVMSFGCVCFRGELGFLNCCE